MVRIRRVSPGTIILNPGPAFVMAAINTKVVRRSHAQAGLPYGADFRYDESQLCSSRAKALLSAGGLGAVMAGTFFSPTRALPKKVLPDPGEAQRDHPQQRLFRILGMAPTARISCV